MNDEWEDIDEEEKKKKLSWKDVPSEIVTNFPSSAAKFGKDIYTAVRHPVETAKGLGRAGLGLAQSVIPGEQGYEKYPEAILDFMKERYGGLENLKQTIATDPVGFMADFSTLLGGGGAALRGAGALSKTTALGTAGKALQKGAEFTEPLGLTGKAAKYPAKGIGWTGKQYTGFLTGKGAENVQRAYEGDKTFRRGLRGQLEAEDVLKEMTGGLQQIKEQRAFEYGNQLQKVAGYDQPLDISRLNNVIEQTHKRFRLDKDIPTLNKTEMKEYSQIMDMIDDWKTKPEGLTPLGLDSLKQQLDNYYAENTRIGATVSGLRRTIKDILNDNVPEYKQMTSGYEKSSVLIREIDKAFSLNKRSSADTAIRKLMTTMREDLDFRRNLIKQVEQSTGKNIEQILAGVSMQELMPSGLVGKSVVAGSLGYLLFGGFDPKLVGILAMSSPRVVGEFANLLGRFARQGKKIIPSTPVRQATFQSGRLNEMESNQIEPYGGYLSNILQNVGNY